MTYQEIIEELEAELMKHGYDEDLTEIKEEYIDLAESEIADPIERAQLIEHIIMMIGNQYMSY